MPISSQHKIEAYLTTTTMHHAAVKSLELVPIIKTQKITHIVICCLTFT